MVGDGEGEKGRKGEEGATHGVTVSTSGFLNLPPMLLCGFESRLGLESSGSSPGVFSGYSCFLLSFIC